MDESKTEYREQKDLNSLANKFVYGEEGNPGSQIHRFLANWFVFSLMVNGLQLSIILLLLDILLPINFYNVLRIVGSFVIPTLPDWGDNT